MHKWIYLGLFVIINLWTIVVSPPWCLFVLVVRRLIFRFSHWQIHDGDMISGHLLEKYINSPAHHTLHHMYFTCNYGQVSSQRLRRQ